MSRVNVDFVAFGDVRFTRLAQLLGYADHDHARAKVEYLWAECTRRCTTKLPQWVVESLLGESAPAALIESELARWAGGRGDSKTRLMHIAGASERCLWLRPKREQTSNAGKARAHGAQRRAGRFVPASAGDAPPAKTSAPAPAPAPAPSKEESAAAPLVLVPDPPKPKSDQQVLTDLFFARYESAYGTKPTWDGKQAGQIAGLLKKHSVAELTARMEFMFAGRAKWPPPPYTLDCYIANIDRWVEANADTRQQPRPRRIKEVE